MAHEPKLAADVLDRMKRAAKDKGLTHQDISDASRVPIATVQRVMRGATDPQFMTMYRVVAALGVSLDYVITGDGKDDYNWDASLPALAAGQRRVPIYDVMASAGDGASVLREMPTRFAAFPSDYLSSLGEADELQIIRISGDSMEPEFKSGDQVMVDRSKQPLREGVYIIRIDQELVIKRIQIIGNGQVRLISNNPAYPPMEKRLDDDGIEVIGRVVWTGRAL